MGAYQRKSNRGSTSKEIREQAVSPSNFWKKRINAVVKEHDTFTIKHYIDM